MRLGKILGIFILVLIAVLQIFPLVWLFSYSIKASGELFSPQLLSFTGHPHWENYARAFTDGKILQYLTNTVLVCVPSVLLSTIIPFCMAYACTRMNWHLKKLVWFIIVIGLTIPIHTTLLPNFIWFKSFHLIDSRLGLIIAYTAFSISFNVIIFAGLLKSIPTSMEESAFIDGAGYFRVLVQIIAPMTVTGFITTGIQTLLSHWNEFIMANTYISSEIKRTLPFSIIRFQGQYSADYAAQFACMFLVALPPLILYFAFNKWILAGVSAGAVKE